MNNQCKTPGEPVGRVRPKAVYRDHGAASTPNAPTYCGGWACRNHPTTHPSHNPSVECHARSVQRFRAASRLSL